MVNLQKSRSSPHLPALPNVASRLLELVKNPDASVDEVANLIKADLNLSAKILKAVAAANEQISQLALQAQVASTQAEFKQKVLEVEKQKLANENELLQEQALRDPLTGIYNRRYFDDAISREVCCAIRHAAPLAVLFFDVDRFKQVNDTRGHAFGDYALHRIAGVVGEVLRRSDVLARYGGEEFVVIVNHPTEKGLVMLGERIRHSVEQEQILCQGERVPITVSLGGVITVPARTDKDVVQRLLAEADQALFEAKHAGRNQVRMRVLLANEERILRRSVARRRFSRWLVNNRIIDHAAVSRALLNVPTERRRIGELARLLGLLDESHVESILEEQRATGARFGEAALRLGFLDQKELVELLSFQQEDPRQFASALIKLGIINPQTCAGLLEHYWRGTSISAPPAVTV